MTPQDQFNTAVLGVLAQGGPAVAHNGACLYRACDGKKCAFGHLIPDDEYVPQMEGRGAVSEKFDSFFEAHTDYDRGLIIDLQNAHDSAFAYANGETFMDSFKDRARKVALKHELDASCLEA